MIKIDNTLNLRVLLASIALAAAIPAAHAAPVGQLTTFVPGTPAKASEINANFDSIKTTVNANDARIAALEAQIAQLSRQVGFAHIVTTGTTSSVGTFGGIGTTQVSVTRNGVGFYSVTFTGVYPATIAVDKIVLLSTATSSNFQVTNNFVASANPTTIVVGVFTWTSNALALVDDSFDVLVLLGN